jgi:hypothetical protein
VSDRERSATLEQAIRWLSDRRREAPDVKPAALVDEAARRFDLSPRDADFLLDLARKGTTAGPA